ncbi:hypothetical protein [Paraburkholderia acidipaludis]|uniref:hypothetical protein n=1 Tax=Paraburkholderia acidipaludis TaxID=660537 RepID=UPI0004834805|nr:hypothetical protein [Paraburkholderia acidipaludis]
MTDIVLTRKFGEPFPIFDSISAASDAITKAAFRLYVVINPDHSADDFLREVLMPIAQSSAESPTQIEVRVFKNHSEQSFVIYMRAICHACAYVQEARNAHNEGRESEGWSHIANAHYLLGYAEGIFALEPALVRTISARARKNSSEGDEKRYGPLRKLARELAAAGNYKSKRNAALSIKDRVIAESRKTGVNMSEAQAEKTITAWLEGMTFARKQGTSAG